MEIYLIRHTTPDVEKGICYGQTDLELTSTFPEEAEKILKQLPRTFDKVYSSPLKRCTQLAYLIDKDYATDNRLMELNFGDWELKKWNDIPKSEIEPWYNDWVYTPAKQGESFIQLQNRILSFFNETPTMNRIAIVAHAGVIRALWSYLNNKELKDSFNSLTLEYGAVVNIVYTP